MQTTEEKPKGVVGILTGPDGHVWASVTDFDTSGYGGFSLQEAQEVRVQTLLAFEFIRKTCSDIVVQAMGPLDCKGIVGTLISKHGFKRTIIPIGHPAED